MSRRRVAFALLLAVVAGATTDGILTAQAEQASRQPSLVESTDYSLFGNTRSRNMVSPAKGLPERWNVETGENVLWMAELGSQSYGGPVLYKDRIFVGTNNEGRRNPKLTGDRGVLMAFDADRRQVPLAVGARQARLRPRQRLAAAGHLRRRRTSRATGSGTSPTAPS